MPFVLICLLALGMPSLPVDAAEIASSEVEIEATALDSATAPPSFFIHAVGDLNLAGNAEPTIAKRGYDWAFDGTRALLAQGALNIANLETAVTSGGTRAQKRFTFRMPPRSLDAVKAAGFSLVSLANNHTLDYGVQGLLDTLKALDGRGIAWAGPGKDKTEARRPAIVEVEGLKVGFLSYSLTFPKEFWADKKKPGTAFGHERWVRADVAALRERVDLVLVAFHWSAEKLQTPKEYQRVLARAAVEAGADAIIGHHPHVLQGVELIEGRPVLYSLGNYAFGSNSNSARDAAVARLVVESGRLTRLEMIPLHVHNRYVEYNPQVAEGEVQTRILDAFDELSAPLGVRGERREGRWIVPLEVGGIAERAPEPPPEEASTEESEAEPCDESEVL